MLVGTLSRRTNTVTLLGSIGMICSTRGTLPGDVRLNSLVTMPSFSDFGVAFTRQPNVEGGMSMSTRMLEPGDSAMAVALRRLRRLLFTQRFTVIEMTGVLIFVVVQLPMNGFIVDIIVCNSVARFLLRHNDAVNNVLFLNSP